VHDESNHRQRPKGFAREPARKIRQQRGDVAGSGPSSGATFREPGQELGHPADGADAVPGYRDHDGHFQNELEHIGPEHTPEAAERNINASERHQEENAN